LGKVLAFSSRMLTMQ